MLPAEAAGTRSVTGVAADLIAAMRAPGGAVRSTVLVVVDGLGASSLKEHAGHARTLSGAMSRKDVAASVFPSTTTSALTSILTGVQPGEHGLVGYQVLDRTRDRLINQLTDWESAGIDPFTWQSVPTVFETLSAAGHPTYAVGVPKFANTGFTRAILRGARFMPAVDPADRVELAWELAAAEPGAFVYCYLPEADQAGHRHGVASGEWIAALEEIDGALRRRVPDRVGVIVTADHGMVDVPARRQVILDAEDVAGIRHFGGEPRMLHAYLRPDADPADLLRRWRERLDGSADVVSKAEAISAGLFGPRVTVDAADRIGDVLALARGNRALYDGTAADQRSRGMIGQHGSITPEERRVPVIRLGALAD